MYEKVLKILHSFLSWLFEPTYKVLLSPEKRVLFQRNRAPVFFENLESLLSFLEDKRSSFLLYVEGFEQEVITETLPSLESLERRSYLRHRVKLLLEKTPLIFWKKTSSEVSFLLQNCDFLGRFETVSPFLCGVRSLSLELSQAWRTSTLCRLILSDHYETLIYGRDEALYLTRSIQTNDSESYDKTLRYIERQFHQSESTLTIQKWTLNDVQAFMWHRRGNAFGSKVGSREGFKGPFYGRLGLKLCVYGMAILSVFLGGDLYQGWQEKEALQQQLFALKNNLGQIHSSKRELPLSSDALKLFEKALKGRGEPLKNLELLAPVNSGGTDLQGIVWRRSHQGGEAQVVFEICSSKMNRDNFEKWMMHILHSKTPFLNISLRDESQNNDVFEEEEGSQACLITEISSFEPPSKEGMTLFEAGVEEEQ